MIAARHDLASAFRRAALPLACYYTMTLLVPLANGAGGSGTAFLEHAVVVAGVPLVLVVLATALAGCVRCVARAVPLRLTVPPRMPAARESGADTANP